MRKQQKPGEQEDDLKDVDDYDDDDADEEESLDKSVDSVKSKRGRPRVPEQWSRVISLSTDSLENLKTFELAPDLLLSNAMAATLTRGKIAKEWSPHFWPDDYIKEGHNMSVEENKLSKSQLERLGQRATLARKIQRERASAVIKDGGYPENMNEEDAEAYLMSTERLARKMHMGYFRAPKSENIYYVPQLSKRESWSSFTLDDKINVVHDVLILKRPQKEVAKKYFRTEGYISQLVGRVRKKSDWLREMIDKRDQTIAKEETVQDVINELIEEHTFIENVDQVVKEV